MDMERINTQLSLLHEKAITSVDLGGGQIDSECREDQQLIWRGSTVNVQCREDQQSM